MMQGSDSMARAAKRPVESFGGEYVVMSRKGPQEVAAKIATWRDAGGTHAAVLTMGLGVGSTDAHIEYLAAIADVLGREPAGR
jgi:hypothetical protein